MDPLTLEWANKAAEEEVRAGESVSGRVRSLVQTKLQYDLIFLKIKGTTPESNAPGVQNPALQRQTVKTTAQEHKCPSPLSGSGQNQRAEQPDEEL